MISEVTQKLSFVVAEHSVAPKASSLSLCCVLSKNKNHSKKYSYKKKVKVEVNSLISSAKRYSPDFTQKQNSW